MKDAIADIAEKLRRFAEERDWEQFHSPKNLAMAMTVEVAELLEHFQWLTEEQSNNLPPEKKALAAEEIADIQIYLIRMADKLGIDIHDSVRVKIGQNEKKYPTDRVRGDARKYSEYHDRQESP
jgi:dCTP diphosphatase